MVRSRAGAIVTGMKKMLPLVVLVPFAVFSTFVAVEHGALGFLTLALREPWAMQLLLDLTIALFLVGTWLRRDARARGIAALPYLVALPLLGSIAVLVYLVHRNVVQTRDSAAAQVGPTSRDPRVAHVAAQL